MEAPRFLQPSKTPDNGIPVPPGQIPLTPCTVNFTVIMPDGTKVSVGRRQCALTGGYAFTDIKSQGQTIEVLIADLRDTPTGKISPFICRPLPKAEAEEEILFDFCAISTKSFSRLIQTPISRPKCNAWDSSPPETGRFTNE